MELYLRRRQLGRLLSPDDVLEEILGGFFVELHREEEPARTWQKALRRTFYQIYERPHRKLVGSGIEEERFARPQVQPDPDPVLEPGLLPLIEALRSHNSSSAPALGRLANEVGLSRRALRVMLTRIARSLHRGDLFRDLQVRGNRVLRAWRSARPGKIAPHLEAVRRLRNYLRVLDLPPELQTLLRECESAIKAGAPKTPRHGRDSQQAVGE